MDENGFQNPRMLFLVVWKLFFSAAPCHLAMATKTSNSGGFPVELPHVEVDGVATGQPEASIGGLWLHNVAHKMWIVVPQWPVEHSGAAKANHEWSRIIDSISLLGRIWSQNMPEHFQSLVNKGVIGRPTRSKSIETSVIFFNERSNECSSHFQSFWIHWEAKGPTTPSAPSPCWPHSWPLPQLRAGT